MNTPDETSKTARPNYWLRAIEFRKHQLTREYRATLGDKSREGISDEDYATTMATLEKMARNLGWDDTQAAQGPFGRGFGPGRGFDRRHFGRAGFGPGAPFGNGHRGHEGHHGHPGHDQSAEATDTAPTTEA